jgi:hypothetical protein
MSETIGPAKVAKTAGPRVFTMGSPLFVWD